ESEMAAREARTAGTEVVAGAGGPSLVGPAAGRPSAEERIAGRPPGYRRTVVAPCRGRAGGPGCRWEKLACRGARDPLTERCPQGRPRAILATSRSRCR